MTTTRELQDTFAGCETAQNIIRDQIGDVSGVAVWRPWLVEPDDIRRAQVTVEQIVAEVQEAWEADPEYIVPVGEIAALRWIARREGASLRTQWKDWYDVRNPGIPREIVEAWLYAHAPKSAGIAIRIISQEIALGAWKAPTLGDAIKSLVATLMANSEFDDMYFPDLGHQAIAAAEEIRIAYMRMNTHPHSPFDEPDTEKMTETYYIAFRGDHPGTRYWDGDWWTPNVHNAAHYAPRDLPDSVPSVQGLYGLERCALFVIGHTGTYDPPQEYLDARRENPDDQAEWLDDEYGESYYEIRLSSEISDQFT